MRSESITVSEKTKPKSSVGRIGSLRLKMIKMQSSNARWLPMIGKYYANLSDPLFFSSPQLQGFSGCCRTNWLWSNTTSCLVTWSVTSSDYFLFPNLKRNLSMLFPVQFFFELRFYDPVNPLRWARLLTTLFLDRLSSLYD